MTSTTQYFKKSMNAIYEIDDGAGTVISDGVVNCNSFNAANLNTSAITANNAVITNIQNTNLTSDNANITTSYIDYLQNYNMTSAFVEIATAKITSSFRLLGSLDFSTPSYSIPAQFYPDYTANDFSLITQNPLTKINNIVQGENALCIEKDQTTIFKNLISPTLTGNNVISNYGTITNINSTTINNSGTTTTGTLNSSNIQPTTAATTTNLFTTNTGIINTGGSGFYNINGSKIFINGETRAGATGNYYTEISNGGAAGTFIDFHSANNPDTDYDARIICTGGTAAPGTAAGKGTLNIQASSVSLGSAATTINIGATAGTNTINGTTNLAKNGNYNLKCANSASGCIIDFNSSNTASLYDSRIIGTGGSATDGQGKLDITSKTINLNSQSTGSISLNGLTTNISQNGNYNIEFVNNSSTGMYIDFHSSNTASNYDSRISATGGSATDEQGTLTLQALNLQLGTTGTPTLSIGTSTGTNTINGTTNISKNGNYNVKSSNSASGCILDFNSSNTASAYDSRISATGGSATAGQGVFNILTTTLNLATSGTPTINIGTATGTNTINGTTNLAKNGTYNIECATGSSGAYIDFHSGTSVNYDSRIIATGGSLTTGSGTLQLISDSLYLTTNNFYFGSRFRYTPWTLYNTGITTSTFMNYPTTLPTMGTTGSVVKARYSINGNSLFMQLYAYVGSVGTAGSGGSGIYQYLIPSMGATVDWSQLVLVSTTSPYTPNATRVGTFNIKTLPSGSVLANITGCVYPCNFGGNYGLILHMDHGQMTGYQSTANYTLGSTNVMLNFEAQLPLVL